jgi:membrane-associated phospholipid phosphatase
MPSLHTTYAIAIGVAGVVLARHAATKAVWALYPGLVVFSIVATANHFVLDAAAGALTLAFATGVAVAYRSRRRRARASAFEPALEPA